MASDTPAGQPATLPAAAVQAAVTAAIASLSKHSDTSLWLTAAEGTVGGLLARRELLTRALGAAAPHLRTIVEPIDIKPGGRIIIRLAAPARGITARYAAEARERTLAALNLAPSTPAVICTQDVEIEADNRAAALECEHAELLDDLLASTPESFGDDVPAEEIAVRWVRHLEARVNELEAALRDVLSRFTETGDGHRARAGQVQIGMLFLGDWGERGE